MAFQCCISKDTFSAEILATNGDYAILVHIGFDYEDRKNYFAHIGLSPMAGGELEYYFNIIEVDGENDAEYAFHSGLDTTFIQGDDRRTVLLAICAATESLLTYLKPTVVHRVSYDANLPDRALEKHHAISSVFQQCGYTVTTADPYHGKRVWCATRA